MSLLYNFYCNGGRTATGLQLEQVLGWCDEHLESNHAYIQWLFPLMERSRYNPLAPRLTERCKVQLLSDERFAPNMQRAFNRMAIFYGLSYEGDALVANERFGERSTVWLTRRNHNYLRLTRIMRSLRLFGFEEEARALFVVLRSLYESGYADVIGEKTYRYWLRTQGVG